MDITSLVGLFIGVLAVLVGQVLESGGNVMSILTLVQPTAFMIVMGGTTGTVLLGFPANDLKEAFTSLGPVFAQPDPTLVSNTIEQIVSLATKARKEGLLALQNEIKSIEHPFLKKGLELMTDGIDAQLIRDMLETEIGFLEEKINGAAKVWESAGGFAPTVGILGAVLGLIHVMENLSDPSKLGSGIAVAFVATVYGVGFANLLFIPMGSKVKLKRKLEIHLQEMMLEGIMAIQAGESPNFIRQKLAVFDHSHHDTGGEEH